MTEEKALAVFRITHSVVHQIPVHTVSTTVSRMASVAALPALETICRVIEIFLTLMYIGLCTSGLEQMLCTALLQFARRISFTFVNVLRSITEMHAATWSASARWAGRKLVTYRYLPSFVIADETGSRRTLTDLVTLPVRKPFPFGNQV